MELELICRICLSNIDQCSNIFTDLSSDRIPIYEVINYVYDLEISVDDGLAENVCQVCLETIMGFEKYKRDAHRAKSKLISLRERNNVFIKVEKEDNGNIMSDNVTTVGHFLEPQVMLESNIVPEKARKVPETPPCLQDVDCGGINYIEYHDSMRTDIVCKKEPEEEENWAYDESMANSRWDSSDELGGMKILESYGESDIVVKEEEEIMKSDAASGGIKVKREYIEEGVNEEDYPTCHHCGGKRETLAALKEHIYSEHLTIFVDKERKVSDGKCKVNRYNSWNDCVVAHERKRTDKKQYKCDYCEYTCARSNDLRRHRCRHTGEKPYKCDYCEYNTSRKNDLLVHERKHTGEKPYECEYCEYSSSRKDNLLLHKLKHTGEKPYKCEYCEWSFSKRCHLKDHTRKHTGEKPHKCEYCEWSFSKSCHLKDHIRKHTGEKPHKCEYCESRFAKKCHLKEHIRKHTGEKPFQCGCCEYKCSTRSGLSIHKRKHIRQELNKC